MPEFFAEVTPLVKEGKIKWKEDIKEVGIEKYVETLNLLFSGGNFGKLMMKIAD